MTAHGYMKTWWMLMAATIVAISAFVQPARAQDPIAVPALTGRVVDLTGTLSAGEQRDLSARLKAFEDKKGTQIAVLIVPSIGVEAIEEFGIRVAEKWKIGRKNVDDGAIIIIAKQERKMRIEVGRGLEAALPDVTASRIIRDVMAPKFRQGDFYGGLTAASDTIMKVVDGEALPPPSPRSQAKASQSTGFDPSMLMFALFAIVIFGSMLKRLLGRFLGSAATGGATGFVASLLASSVGLGVLIGVIVFIGMLIFSLPSMFTGGPRYRRGGGPWISSGGWSSGGGGWSSGGDGGGFSGGGGDFGGGGASGDW